MGFNDVGAFDLPARSHAKNRFQPGNHHNLQKPILFIFIWIGRERGKNTGTMGIKRECAYFVIQASSNLHAIRVAEC